MHTGSMTHDHVHTWLHSRHVLALQMKIAPTKPMAPLNHVPKSKLSPPFLHRTKQPKSGVKADQAWLTIIGLGHHNT